MVSAVMVSAVMVSAVMVSAVMVSAVMIAAHGHYCHMRRTGDLRGPWGRKCWVASSRRSWVAHNNGRCRWVIGPG